MGTFAALRHHRNYQLFWFGQLISVTGTWLQSTGQAWLVLKLTSSPLALGIVSGLQYLPVLALGLIGGVAADRFDKRRTLVVTQSAFAVLAAVLAALTATGLVRLWQVYALALLNGLVAVVDNPTRQAFVVDMVGPDDVPNAVALNSAVFNSARAVGPAVAGGLIAGVGLAMCFYLNAASYLAVIGGLLLMRPELLRVVRARREAVGAAVRGGVVYVLRNRTVLLLLVLLGVIGTFGMENQVLIPVLADNALKVGAVGFGVLSSANGVGALIGALGVATLGRVSGRLLLAGALAYGLATMALGLPLGYAGSAIALGLAGGASLLFTAATNSLLQLMAPEQMRGRVMGVYTLLFSGTVPIGAPLIGDLAARVGVAGAFLAEGLVAVAAAAWGALTGLSAVT